ncbi:hypothetical protein ACIGFK_13450 [Streptomyces sp. NPDC085524]|uniref:hypothetical protein n=1 Tax=Streptomyces sp. NPDC085524 TaxID=3365728 RepID=UPI0037D7D5D4
MASMHRIRQETIERLGPEPTTPLESLAHTLAAHAEQSDDWVVVEATNNVYGDGVRTGLTLGDLRALHQQLAND